MNAVEQLEKTTEDLYQINCMIVRLVEQAHHQYSASMTAAEGAPPPAEMKEEETPVTVFDVHRRLYQIQSQFLVFSVSDADKVPCTPYILSLHLLWAVMWCWLRQMCQASGGRLHFPRLDSQSFTSPVPSSCPLLTPSVLDWSHPTAAGIWHRMLNRVVQSWELPETFCKTPPPPLEEEEVKHDGGNEESRKDLLYGLHTLVTFGQHYFHFRSLTSVLFSRVDVASPRLRLNMLHAVVKTWIDSNKTSMQRLLRLAVDKTIGKELLETDILIYSLPQTPLRPRHRPFHSDTPKRLTSVEDVESPWEAAAALSPYDRIQEVDAKLIYCVVWFVEECDPSSSLLRGFSAEVQALCTTHGGELAERVLGKFCAPPHPNTGGGGGGPTSPHDGGGGVWNTFQLAPGISFNPTLSDVNKALREITEAYARLRASLLLLTSGTTHYLDHITTVGRSIVGKGLERFLDGFCAHPYAHQFMATWGVELWIQACTARLHKEKEEEQRRLRKQKDQEPGGRAEKSPMRKNLLVQHHLEAKRRQGSILSTSSPKKSTASLGTSLNEAAGSGNTSTVLSLHPARSRAVSEVEIGAGSVLDGSSLVNPLGLPLPGTAHSDLKTDANAAKELRELAILPTDGFVALFHLLPREKCESGVQMQSLFTECVSEYLEQQLQSESEEEKRLLLPRAVFDSCVLALQLTPDLFIDDEEEQRRGPSLSAQAADSAVRLGIQIFFTHHSAPAAQTIALAINAQVVEGDPSLTPTMVDTLLDLASLLPSKEPLVRRYKSLVAPRVVLASTPKEIETDAEVVDKIAQCVGVTVAAPCIALFRDLKQAIQDNVSLTACAEEMQRTGSLSLAKLTPTATNYYDAVGPQFLLRSVRILCEAWWAPHAPVLLSASRAKRLYQKEGWFEPSLVDAMLRLEWYYRKESEAKGAYKSFTETDKEDPKAAPAAPSTSRTTSMVRDISSAIGSAVNNNRWYSNLRRTEETTGAFGNEDPNDDEDFTEAYGGLLPAASNFTDLRSLSASSMGDALTEKESTVVSIPADGVKREAPSAVVARDRHPHLHPLSFLPLLEGTTSKKSFVQVSAPPIVYLLLQFLLRDCPTARTFDYIYQHLPVHLSKALLSHVLKYLVLTRLVCRETVQVEGGAAVIVYAVAENELLESLLGTKLAIDLSATIASIGEVDPPRTAHTTTEYPVSKSSKQQIHHLLESRRRQRQEGGEKEKGVEGKTSRTVVEAITVSIMKKEKSISHRDLFSQVEGRLTVPLTVTLFKMAIKNLIEKEFIYREPEGMKYVYAA